MNKNSAGQNLNCVKKKFSQNAVLHTRKQNCNQRIKKIMKTKSRFKIEFSVFALLILICAGSCTSPVKENNPPNIIVFLVDDMGLMDTSVPFLTDMNDNVVKYPLNNYYKTPNMEKLAQQGVRFTNFYAHSVCSPTRTSILTGQNSARHGVTNWIRSESNNRTEFGPTNWNWKGLNRESVTLPRILQQAGYKTIHVGKAHFGPFNNEGEDPLNLGFDVNIAGSSIGQPGSYLGTEGFGHTGGNNKRAVPGLEKYHGKDIFLTEALTLEANLAISQAKEEGKPFFLNMAHYAVHAPFYSDPRFEQNYKNSGKPEKAQAYATLIEGIDKSLGDIVQHVKELGLGENTLIFFLGDNGSDAPLPIENGYSSSSPLKGKKGNHWEGGMRVPFIASWVIPNENILSQEKLPIARNAIQQQMGSILDLFPTLCQVANVNSPEGFVLDGFDLQDQLMGKQNEIRDESFLNHFPHSHRSNYFTSLVKSDWKIIYHYQVEDQPRYELFNLKNDPFETNNVADENPEQLKMIMNVLSDEMKSKKALYPEKENLPLELIMPI
jgi:arylsulfatase A-like enzyme